MAIVVTNEAVLVLLDGLGCSVRVGDEAGWLKWRTALEAAVACLDPAEVVGLEAVLDTTGPTDYEVWRDALQLACATISDGPDWSPRVLRENAEWFHEQLLRGAPTPAEPDCSHCGADSSMDHNDDCPAAALAQVLTNHESADFCEDCGSAGDCDENCPRADEDEDPTDNEVDCVRCGAPPGGHPDGCPTMVGPD